MGQRLLRFARAELRAAADELLRASTAPGGHGEVEPLLSQLRAEVAASTSGRGGGGGRAHSPVPIAAAAYDLLQEIETGARANLWSAEVVHRIGGTVIETAPAAMSAEERIRRTVGYLVHREGDLDRIGYVTSLLTWWAGQIRHLLAPVGKALAAPCPVCRVRWVSVDRDGETVQVSAVAYVPGVGVRCAACEHHWPAGTLESEAERAVAAKRAAELEALLDAADATP